MAGGNSSESPLSGIGKHLQVIVDNFQREHQKFIDNAFGGFRRNRINRAELFSDLFPSPSSSNSSSSSRGASFQFHSVAAQPRTHKNAFASISSSRNGPVYTVALTPHQMAPALEGVPVWTVTNQDNEFVLVSQNGESGKQMGFFCFNERDAQVLLKQVNGKNSGIDGGGQVVPLTLDKMVSLSTGADPTAAGIAFRLIPDAQEVHQALKITASQGSPLEKFPGVPVFAVQGLTILGKDDKKHVPLFLSARDVEVAVGAAKEDGQPFPAVETGSLETVLNRMKDSPLSPEWSQMVLIPSLSSRQALFALTGKP